MTILLFYVDNLLIIGDNCEEIVKLKEALQQEFEMIDLGHATNYLGDEIHRQSDGIFVCQNSYIKKLLEKFNMQDYNPMQLSIDPNAQLQKLMGTELIDPTIYKSLVGSL